MQSREKYYLSEKEKLKTLHGKQKLQYILDYYKLPLVIIGIFLYIIIYIIYGQIHHKDTVLYTAFVNITAGEELTKDLSTHFLESQNIDTAKNELYLYSNLYLTNDENSDYHEYTYASRMKILAAIDAEQLDIVFMNKEAFNAFSQNGYLCNLEALLSKQDAKLYKQLKSHLVTNTSILEDNSIDLLFDDSISYKAKTENFPMGLDLSQSPIIKKAGFKDTVYFGIISNSPRLDDAISYLQYLY